MGRKFAIRLQAMSAVLFSLAVSGGAVAQNPVPPKGASDVTNKANADVLNQLPYSNRSDYEDAKRGFIASDQQVSFKNEQGRTVWDLGTYAFLNQAEAPPTVNPSLWRIAQLNMRSGLFKVTDRVYQIRGYDLSNMSIIEGDTGLIIIDPLISTSVS